MNDNMHLKDNGMTANVRSGIAACLTLTAAAVLGAGEIRACAWKGDTHAFIAQNALRLLEECGRKEAFELFAANATALLRGSVCPDHKEDTDKGNGFHYYCAKKRSGADNAPAAGGYYRSGTNLFSPSMISRSARTIFEDDYQAALSFYKAGDHEAFAEFSGRCVHMLSDICCPPHTCDLTLTSRYSSKHRKFEDFAKFKTVSGDYAAVSCREEIYELVGKSSFGDILNMLAKTSSEYYSNVTGKESGYEQAAEKMIVTAQQYSSALLQRLYCDAAGGEGIDCCCDYYVKCADGRGYMAFDDDSLSGFAITEKPEHSVRFRICEDGRYLCFVGGRSLDVSKKKSSVGFKIGKAPLGYRFLTEKSGFSRAVAAAVTGALCTAVYDPDKLYQHWLLEKI